jgi:GT2 family glycosyltransferase
VKADIIVLTYGNEDLTARCLRSLRKHTTGYRLIWVDNGSGTHSLDAVMAEAKANHEVVPIWLPENIGFVKGTNVALRYLLEVEKTDADYIVLLNNDVEVTEGWLDRMRRVFERDTKVKAVGPITSECKSWQSYLHARQILPVFQKPMGFETGGTGERAKKLSYAYGELAAKCKMLAFFCTAFKKEVFEEIGYLDEDFGIGYGDDDDFCKRMRDAKMELAVSLGTYVFHNHQSTFKKLFTDAEIEKMKSERLQTYMDKHGEAAEV